MTIVVDQFSANLFNQYRGQFTGGLRTLIDQGHVYVNGYQAQGCGSASKSDPLEWQPRWLNSPYNNTFAHTLTGVCRDPLSPRNITLIQYVISYRVGSRLRRRSTNLSPLMTA